MHRTRFAGPRYFAHNHRVVDNYNPLPEGTPFPKRFYREADTTGR